MTNRTAVIVFSFAIAFSADAATLRVMKQGLGEGSVTSTPAGINCPGDCTETYSTPAMVTLRIPPPPAGSAFGGWSGACSGMGACSVTMSSDQVVHATFNPSPALTPMTVADLEPGPLRTYLGAHPEVNNFARFVAVLPDEFKWNWIMMSRSESLQTGTAETPRFLLPNRDGTRVFTFALKEHTSYPGAHHNAIEYMVFEPAPDNNFHFHEVVLEPLPPMGTAPMRMRDVSEDDHRCTKCHSTRNVLNRRAATLPGTTGVAGLPPGTVPWKNKPNWDTYDSWGGMLPFNRDRIYEGSIEEAAFRKILNLWTWVNDPQILAFIEQLRLQPPGDTSIVRQPVGGANDSEIALTYAGSSTTTPVAIAYAFDGRAGTSTSPVNQGGRFITLHHSDIATSDEGRGVHFFDVLNTRGTAGAPSPNQLRVADEVNTHRFATGSVPIDVRPVTLAIANECFSVNSAMNRVEGTGLGSFGAFFDARNGMHINELINDTDARMRGDQTATAAGRLEAGLTRRKADIQRLNLDRTSDIYMRPATAAEPKNGLFHAYGGVAVGTAVGVANVRQEVFRRVRAGLGFDDHTVMGGFYVDREETEDFNAQRLGLYRYFLEPLGVSVDKWSMGVRGRSRTYTFADVFDSPFTPNLATLVRQDLVAHPIPGHPIPSFGCPDLIAAVNFTFAALPLPDASPTYTDIQRIFNKACIECHGGLGYPPFDVFHRADYLDFSEDESSTTDRFARSHDFAVAYTTNSGVAADSYLFQRITARPEDCPHTMLVETLMPCQGPRLSQADVETIRRWIEGSPHRPYTVGDPHIKTVDNTDYDFQSAGEFTLLRGQGVEIQTRHTPVATQSPLFNAHTGLSACVSLNTAAAFRVGPHRISYVPNVNGRPDPSGLQLRVDGKLTTLGDRGVVLRAGGRILPTPAPGGIQIQLPGGGEINVTPGWWPDLQLWYLNVELNRVRATEGLMGAIAPTQWLPALPDGTFLGTRPGDAHQRYQDLYVRFADAWRVTNQTSLFDYAPGNSTQTFTFPSWPAEAPQSCLQLPSRNTPVETRPRAPLPRAVAEQQCAAVADPSLKANCIQDVMVTGEASFAKTYALTEQLRRNSRPAAPSLTFPPPGQMNLGTTVTFTWNPATDRDGDGLTYMQCVWKAGDPFTFDKCTTLPRAVGPLSGPVPCVVLLVLLLLFLVILFLLLRVRRLRIVWALLLIAVVIAAFFVYRHDRTGPLSNKVTGLEPGQVYFWKVVIDDGKGGTTETPMRRFATRR